MIVKKIAKKKEIIKVSPEQTLGQTFSLLSSSHDAAFVVEDDRLLGVINPYYCLIKKSYPANTKIRSCLIHPPKIDINFPLSKVVQLMINSKIHYLPVFLNGRFWTIVSARQILSFIQDLPLLNIPISQVLKQKKPLVSIYKDSFISQALTLFKQHRISKLVVVTKNLKLKGVLAYFDLIGYLMLPKKRQSLGAREGDKTPLLRKQVKNFIKTNVLTLGPNDKLSLAAKMILKKKIGSVVIVDSENHPIGIITTRDLLTVLARRKEPFQLELVTKRLSQNSWFLVERFINQLKRHLKKTEVVKARLLVKEEKTGGLFKAIISLFFKNHQMKVIKKEGKNLAQVLQELKRKSN